MSGRNGCRPISSVDAGKPFFLPLKVFVQEETAVEEYFSITQLFSNTYNFETNFYIILRNKSLHVQYLLFEIMYISLKFSVVINRAVESVENLV